MNQFMPALVLKLKSMKVTTMLVEEISTFGLNEGRQIAELSAINENVLLLHHEDIDDEIVPALTILKMRNSGFDKETRKLILSSHGIKVEGKVLAPEILPTNKIPVIEKGTTVKRLDGKKKKTFFKRKK
jgi:hypothetical protein